MAIMDTIELGYARRKEFHRILTDMFSDITGNKAGQSVVYGKCLSCGDEFDPVFKRQTYCYNCRLGIDAFLEISDQVKQELKERTKFDT